MPYKIDVLVFDKPSENVRGVVSAMFTRDDGKLYRVAHTYLMVNKQPEIELKIPGGKLSVTEVDTLSKCLTEFAASVVCSK